MTSLSSAGSKPTIPGTNIRVPRWLDPNRIYKNPQRLLNPKGARGGLVYGAALYGANEALGKPLPDKDLAFTEAIVTGGLNPASFLIGAILHDINNPVAHGLRVDERGRLMPNIQDERKQTIARGEADPYPAYDQFGYPPPSPDDIVLSLSSDGTGLALTTRTQRDASLQPPVAREAEEKNNKSDPELMALYEEIKGQPLDPRIKIGRSDPFAPFSDKPDEVNPPLPEPVSPTPNNMESELLKEATTMRRAKEMKELGIHGGDEAMNKGSAMHTWLSTHGDLADNLIRDKRMREVRVAREFDREFDGTMGDFEAFKVNREVG